MAGASVIALTLALKVVRWPDAPVVGDGPGMWGSLLFYAAASLAGAAFGAAARRVSQVR